MCANRYNRKNKVLAQKYPNQLGPCGQKRREDQHRYPGPELIFEFHVEYTVIRVQHKALRE